MNSELLEGASNQIEETEDNLKRSMEDRFSKLEERAEKTDVDIKKILKILQDAANRQKAGDQSRGASSEKES